ncbi:toxin-antitoxin system YwqK family antitoxin [Flavobacterium sp.]|uniref:toxin-antitoxin system YwqK family antitoxin n=1 Tax=Flavobacterium sp. TaxID=239 RepID=UPI0037A5E58A
MRSIFKRALFVLLFVNVLGVQAQNDFNKLDAKGNKNGLWKGNYEDTKNPKYEGTFEHGKEVGTFTFFDNTKTKIVIATREFNAKDNSAYTIFYDQKKNKVSEGKVVNKLFEGQWKYYHKASKVVMTIENYSNGKLEGLRSVFYPSGKIAEEMVYKNNLKNGLYKRYTEAGIIIEESNFKNNEFDGLATFKDPDDGSLVSTGKFLNGKKAGIWQFFNKGKLAKEINMSDLKNASKTK